MTDFQLYTAIDIGSPLCISFDKALEVLEKGEVDDEHGLMRWGSNYTFLVTVKHEDTTFLAIYKPRMGERPLWDFPDGTLCQREVATYLTSEALNWRIVPPTILREGPRGIGSLQLFVDHDPEDHYFTFNKSMFPQLKRMAALDAIANNADRKGGHCLPDPSGRLWGIDHGLTFNRAPKLRTVIWDFAGKPIPEELLYDIQAFCQRIDNPTDDLTRSLGELLQESEMRSLRKRVKRLISTGIYPKPGAGPNRPWPPV